MASTFEDELHEVWAGIRESMYLPPDEDRQAACDRLMRHLTAAARPRNPNPEPRIPNPESRIPATD